MFAVGSTNRSAAYSGLRSSPVNVGSHLIALAIGALQSIQVNVIGQLYGGEALAAIILFAILTRSAMTRLIAEQKKALIFFGLWLLGQVVTDIIRDIPPEDFGRGWAKIGFTAVSFMVCWCLIRSNSRNIFWLALGLAIGLAGRFILFPDAQGEVDPWKFVYGYSATIFAAAIGATRWMRRFAGLAGTWVPLVLVSLVSLWMNSRSLFGIALMAGAYTAFAGYVANRPALVARITPMRFTLILLGGLVASQLIIAGYANLAQSGALGAVARDKYFDQASGDLPLLLGGRVETLVGIEAIKDSPIIGHGSWVYDPHYLFVYFRLLADYGIPYIGDPSQTWEIIPSHSLIVGSWVDAGVLGGLFWAWMFVMSLRAFYGVLKVRDLPTSIIVLMVMFNLWDTPFSPLGADLRLLKGFELAVIMYVVQAVAAMKPAAHSPAARPVTVSPRGALQGGAR